MKAALLSGSDNGWTVQFIRDAPLSPYNFDSPKNFNAIMEWLADNVPNGRCRVGWSAIFFDDEADALICYTAFR
jgi:hypothetical protein